MRLPNLGEYLQTNRERERLLQDILTQSSKVSITMSQAEIHFDLCFTYLFTSLGSILLLIEIRFATL